MATHFRPPFAISPIVAGFCTLMAFGIIGALLSYQQTGKDAVAILKPKATYASHLLFHPHGELLIVASRANEISLSIWDRSTRKMLHSTPVPQWVSGMALTPKADFLVVATGRSLLDSNPRNDGKPRELRLFSFPEMNEVAKITSERHIASLAVSSDGTLVATADMANPGDTAHGATVRDLPTLKERYRIKNLERSQTQVLFSPDGKMLLIADYGRARPTFKKHVARFRMFDAKTGNPIQEFSIQRPVTSPYFHFLPNGKRLIVDAEAISAFDIATGEETEIAAKPTGRLYSRHLAFSTDDRWMIVGSNFRLGEVIRARIGFWDLSANKLFDEWAPNDVNHITALALSPDKKTLAVGGENVHLYNLGGK